LRGGRNKNGNQKTECASGDGEDGKTLGHGMAHAQSGFFAQNALEGR